nr:1,4-dihydroxy-6-naphthoate synthase [Candidatus Eremiobacteraeota bacterium]
VHVHLADIDALNRSAMAGEYDVIKVSYGAIPALADRYRILRSGGALGRGCGPLVVARPPSGTALRDFALRTIAIPGEATTAYLLLRLALGTTPPIVPMRFDRICDAVADGAVDAGLIIHESRFTYADHGLVEIADLGRWWEGTTGMPIPLGAILVRNDIDVDDARRIDAAVQSSLQYARTHEDAIMPYVREHAFEMEEAVMRKHIDLYVNAYSDDLGDEGRAAVVELFRRAREASLIPLTVEATFV